MSRSNSKKQPDVVETIGRTVDAIRAEHGESAAAEWVLAFIGELRAQLNVPRNIEQANSEI